MEPEIVLLGLIFVNFFPLKIFPNNKPPISELIQIEIKNNIINLKLSSEIPEKTINENIVRYIKPIVWIIAFKKYALNDFLKKIFKISPLNSIHEIKEIKINETIKMYE